MPYIDSRRRTDIVNEYADTLNLREPNTAGELNFAITAVITYYFGAHVGNYQTINDISGACTEALAEFRRRVVVDYEDKKIAENGDLY